MYTFTAKDLEVKFDEYNDKYFWSRLEKPRFVVTHTRRRLGCFKGLDMVIEVSDYFARDEHEVMQTLVHEMIHAWQWQEYRDVNHGSTFKRKAEDIRRYGEFDITRTSSVAGVEARSGVDNWCDLVLFDWNHKTWCARPCDGKAFYIKKRFESSSCVSNLKVIRAYGNFDKLTRCSTRLHCEMDITGKVDAFYKDHKVTVLG